MRNMSVEPVAEEVVVRDHILHESRLEVDVELNKRLERELR